MQVAIRSAPWQGLEARLLLATIFLFAFLVRVVVIAGTVGFHTVAAAEPTSDSRIHIALVENLLGGRGYGFDEPTGITPPLYIFFLAALYRLFDSPAAVRLVQTAMAAGGCVLLYAIGRRLFTHTTALAAAGLLSVYPLAAYLAGLHLTENLFLLLVLAAMWQALRVEERPTVWSAVGLGALAGLAALTRAVFLAFLPFLVLWAMIVWGARARRAYAVAATVVLTALAVISPWTVRNYLVFNTFVPVQSNGGMVFWAGNNPNADGGMVWPTARTWTATRPPNDGWYGWRDLTLAEENSLYMRTALAWIAENPGAYLQLLVRKLVRLYGVTRAADDHSLHVPLVVWAVQVGFLLAAVAGLFMTFGSWKRLALPLLLVVFVNITTLLFSGATRYAVPMLPSLALFAGFTATAAWDRLAKGR